MSDSIPDPIPEELGYFYDTIHGRIALEELPVKFRPALKSALSSKPLARLKRISQLGHTSVSFFSATHTRFSHAIGTMLVLNKLFLHIQSTGGLRTELFDEVERCYLKVTRLFGSPEMMVYCHLLLAGLYQDVGELPFQKVSSLHFVPDEHVDEIVRDLLPQANLRRWGVKKIFSVLLLAKDLQDPKLKGGFSGYDLEFLSYLITGDGAPPETTELSALLQLLDGVIDADRLDYVYRDASVTIGSLSRPSTVLETVVAYRPGKRGEPNEPDAPGSVVVNDPRPVTDFLSTRMRLWTFVYSSADVRFRQVLLKTVLDGRWSRKDTQEAFDQGGLRPELTYDEFMALDDTTLVNNIEKLPPQRLEPHRETARKLLLESTLDYESRLLRRHESAEVQQGGELPADLFFDLLADHGHHQLFRKQSVFVRQGLTSGIATEVPLEDSAGALSPLFVEENSAVLVPNSFYLFLPREKRGGRWPATQRAIEDGSIFQKVAWESAKRGLACPSDTRQSGSVGKSISISYCSVDLPTVTRIVRELYRRNHRYWIILRPFDGIGDTSANNSERLIKESAAILALVSTEYLKRALDPDTHVSIEVRTIHDRATSVPVLVLGMDSREKLSAVPGWSWANMNEAWRHGEVYIPNDLPLRDASEEVLHEAVDRALEFLDR
jgi:HD superfamily phosphohydrolase